ncbi:MAG TPA: hypothetical protein VIV61_03250, partial [Candidatus Ozemobacteraceae bacterium]
YGALVSGAGLSPKGSDDAAEAAWYPLFRLPEMAFDHARALREITARLQWQARTAVVGRTCLPTTFRPEALRKLHATILNVPELSDDPAARGIQLGLLEAADDEGGLRFTPKAVPGPDWDPLPW